MRAATIVLVTAVLVTTAAAPSVHGARSAFPGIPSLYVTYNQNCTFTLMADGGTSITAASPPGPTLPPGPYQIQVSMVNPSSGYSCGAPTFSLTGPGVDSVTTFPYESILDNHMLPSLRPSSTYIAEDETSPATTRVYFTTAPTGSSLSLLGSPPGTQTTTATGSTQPDLVGSAVLRYRGKLLGGVSPHGKATLKLGKRSVTSLKAGLYDLAVADHDSRAGFSLQRSGHKPVLVTGALYVGTKMRRVALSAGRWKYFATAGGKTAFVVVAG